MSPLGKSKESSLVRKIDSILFPLVRNLGIESSVRCSEVKKIWHTLFNEPLSCHMVPYKMTEGVILLNVDSSVWLQELNYFKKDIIEKLSPYGIKDVRFKLGKVSQRLESGFCNQTVGEKPLTPEEASYIEKTVSHIIDEEIRETIRRVIKRAISSGKTKVKL